MSIVRPSSSSATATTMGGAATSGIGGGVGGGVGGGGGAPGCLVYLEQLEYLIGSRLAEISPLLCAQPGGQAKAPAARSEGNDEEPARKRARAAEPAAAPAPPPPSAPPPPASESTAIAPLPDLSRNGWASKNKGKWLAGQGGEAKTAFATNLFLAKALEQLAELYKASNTNQYRYMTLGKQAKKLTGLDFEVTDARQLEGIKGFGTGTGIQKVRELLRDGAMQRTQMMQAMPAHQIKEQLSKIHGVGPTTADEWYRRGYTSIEEVVSRDRDLVGAGQPGILTNQQRVGARHYRDLEHRIPREEVTAIVATVRAALHDVLRADGVPEHELEAASDAIGAGSYRRGKPDSGDVDVLLCRKDGGRSTNLLGAVLGALEKRGCELEHLANDDEISYGGLGATTQVGAHKSYRGVIKLPGRERFRRLDLKIYPKSQLGYALLYFTGSDHFNRSMRHYASKLGYSLSDHGLVRAHRPEGAKESYRGTTNQRHAETERDVFVALGLPYVEPVDRHGDITLPDAGGGGGGASSSTMMAVAAVAAS